MKLLVTPTSFYKNKKYVDYLNSIADVTYNTTGRPLTEKELMELIPGMDGVIAGLDDYSDAVIATASDNLKVISRYGVGYEKVNLRSAGEKGIAVTNTPGTNSDAVADLAIGLMLSVARKLPNLCQSVKNDQWVRSMGIELYGKTIGVIGLGAIGRGVAKRAQGFSMKVLAYDPYINEQYARDNDIEISSLEDIYRDSDIISLHLPLTDETRHMINDEAFEAMKQGVIIINTSRGGLIDEAAALRHMSSGKLGGIGLDAFEHEPPSHSALFDFDTVVLTPHTGAHTKEATEKMAKLAIDNLMDILEGRENSNIVNKQYLVKKG